MLFAKKQQSKRLAKLAPMKDGHRIAFVVTLPDDDIEGVAKRLRSALNEYLEKAVAERFNYDSDFDETADFAASNGASIQVIIAEKEGFISQCISRVVELRNDFLAALRGDKKMKDEAIEYLDGLTNAEIEALGLTGKAGIDHG